MWFIAFIHVLLYDVSMEDQKTKNSAAKIRANNKYTKDHYRRYAVYVPIDEAEAMEAIKGSSSANSFILEAIRDKIRQQEDQIKDQELIRETFID